VEGRPAPGQPAASGPAADLTAARARLPHLCGRDPAVLDRAGLVRATIESVAENTSDAAVAPLFWGALVGPAGLVGYRAVNTLDAMVGHLSARHREFGWAAARLDDLANLAPARLTAALAAALAPAVGGRPAAAWRAWRRDAPAHPSPNAGPCEAAFAGALGVRLGGPTTYSYGHSDRPWLGTGREPSAADIDRAVTLSGQVTWSAAALCAGYALIAGHLARRPRGRAGLPRPAGPPVHAVRGGGRARFVGFARRWAVSWRVVGRLARPASGSRGGGRLRLVGPDHPWPGGGPRRPAGQCVPRGGRPDAVRTWGARWSISRRPGGGVEPGRPARRNRRVAR
jgi:adenosylcobinamide-phosphate synthase